MGSIPGIHSSTITITTITIVTITAIITTPAFIIMSLITTSVIASITPYPVVRHSMLCCSRTQPSPGMRRGLSRAAVKRSGP